jgi:hypothetical protein
MLQGRESWSAASRSALGRERKVRCSNTAYRRKSHRAISARSRDPSDGCCFDAKEERELRGYTSSMDNSLIQFIQKEGTQIVLVLFLSFLIGFEREEQKVISEQYRFGRVRTFPLLGLLGYALALFSQGNLLLPAIGFAVVGAFLLQSYRHKLEGVALAGMTTDSFQQTEEGPLERPHRSRSWRRGPGTDGSRASGSSIQVDHIRRISGSK